MTKSVEMSEAANPIDLQLAPPPPLASRLSVADALQQISNASSQTARWSQQQYPQPLSLPDPQRDSLPEPCPFTETRAFSSAIRNTIQPSVWERRDNPLTDPRQPCLPASRLSGVCDPIDLTFQEPADTGSRLRSRQGTPSQLDYCFSAEKQVAEVIGSKLERVVQKLAANASRLGQSGQTSAPDVSTAGQPGQTPATSIRRSGPSAAPSLAGSISTQAVPAPAACSLRTREWVQQAIIREQELRNAAGAVMKDAATALKRMAQPLAEIRQTLPAILNKMTEAMPDLIKQQFDVCAKRYTTTQFPAGMQHTAVGVLTRVITLQARAQVNQFSVEARQLREMTTLENKIAQLRQSVAETSGAAQQRTRRKLGKIQGQYQQCLIAMFPQYSCLNSLSRNETPARMEDVIRYCTDACLAAATEQSQPPIPSQESSTLSLVSEDMPSHSAEPLSPMHISSPPPLSPVRTISEYSRFSFPPVLTAAEEIIEVRHAEAQTDDIPIEDLQSEGVRDAQIQTDDVRSDDMPGVRMQTAEVQTSDILSDEIHSIAVSSPLTPRPAMRQVLINLDRQTSDSSQTLVSPIAISPVRTSANLPQTASASARQQTFGTPLLMWDSIARRLQEFGASILEERLLALADYFSLPQQQWQQLADVHGLTQQGRELMNAWQSTLHKEITETEKTEWLQRFDYYLTQPRKGWEKATPPGTRETTPLASPAIATPPPQEMIALPGAPNLSWLANNIGDANAWKNQRFDAMPKLISLSEMYLAQNTALVIVTPNDRVISAFTATAEHHLQPADLLRMNSREIRSVAVIQYINADHYYAWRLADHQAYFFTRKSNPGRILFNRSGCELKSTATPGYCLTEAAALALPGNKDINGLQEIARIGATLREQVRQVIIALPAKNPRLMNNLEHHLSIQQQAEENRE